MSPSTFKSVYLISKHDFEKKSSKDFKLSLENKDICDGGVNVSIKPVKNRQANINYIPPNKEQFHDDNSPSQKRNSRYMEKDNKAISDDIFDRKGIGQKSDYEKNNYILKRKFDTNDRDKIVNQENSGVQLQNKNVERRSIEDLNETGITKIQEYKAMPEHRMKRRTFKGPYFRPNKASTRKLIRFKSQNVDPRIGKNKGRLKLNNIQNYNTESQNALSNNDEANAHTTEYIGQQYPTIHLDHNTKNLDNPSDNMDNMENIDTTEKDASTNSAGEKTNFADVNQDQWVGSLKSKLNDRRVQFKRKRDTVGYRINPDIDDIAKSLVTPSDFKFLDKADSDEYLSKWKSLKTGEQKPYSIKKFKSYS